MNTTGYAGIDYGLGRANIDTETGYRYGVISRQSLASWVYDEMEPIYVARCPKTGDELPDSFDPYVDEMCPICKDHEIYDGEQYGDEPDGWKLDVDGFTVEFTEFNMFVLKSPYVVNAQFCSPCAPGAGDLDNLCASGPLTYALPPDWINECPDWYQVTEIK